MIFVKDNSMKKRRYPSPDTPQRKLRIPIAIFYKNIDQTFETKRAIKTKDISHSKTKRQWLGVATV